MQGISPAGADPRSDIWALGTFLYELVTATLPFVGDTLPEICTKILQSEPPRLRGVMGRVFNRVVQALALPGLSDTQCGFKGFRTEAARRIFAAQTVDRFGFDVELLYLARLLGYRIDEQPVVCVYHGDSSVNRLGDVVGMLRDVVLIRWRNR